MSVVENTCTDDFIHLSVSGGQQITITKEEILDHFMNETAEDRQTATIIWIKNQIMNAVSISEIDPTSLFVDFNVANGSPLFVQIGG